MRTIVFGLILFLCIFQFGFAKIYNGIGMQMTKNGTGVYYKQLCSLTEVSQFTASSGLHFDNTRQKTGILGLDNNYQSIMLDLTTGYRSELFQKELSGSFRPIFIFGAGGISEIKSFSKDNIAVKRPGNGLSPMKWDEIIGTQSKRDYDLDELIII